RLAQDRIAGRLPHDGLLLLEHPPVITLGRNSQAEHVLAEDDGVEVFEIERGGDVTYHGPGQLVGYPIIDLTNHRQDLHWYLRTLEQALIEALARLGIPAERKPGFTGVWTAQGQRKIGSIGGHVRQWVTRHAFALHVSQNVAALRHSLPARAGGWAPQSPR